MYLSLARAGRPAAGQGAHGRARRSTGLPVGHVRAQPRRADPRQAHRRGARRRSSPPSAPSPTMQIYGRGLKRRLPTMLGRRPAAHPDGLQPAVLAARHPGALLRRGDRDGRGPRRPRAGWPCAPRCSGRRAQRRLLDRRPASADPAAGAGRLRARRTSTSRPAARPRLAVDLHARADPALPGVPRARAGASSRSSSSRAARSWPTACTWEGSSIVALHNLSPNPVTTQLELETERARLARRPARPRVHPDRPARHRRAGSRRVRTPLAASASRRPEVRTSWRPEQRPGRGPSDAPVRTMWW